MGKGEANFFPIIFEMLAVPVSVPVSIETTRLGFRDAPSRFLGENFFFSQIFTGTRLGTRLDRDAPSFFLGEKNIFS